MQHTTSVTPTATTTKCNPVKHFHDVDSHVLSQERGRSEFVIMGRNAKLVVRRQDTRRTCSVHTQITSVT